MGVVALLANVVEYTSDMIKGWVGVAENSGCCTQEG